MIGHAHLNLEQDTNVSTPSTKFCSIELAFIYSTLSCIQCGFGGMNLWPHAKMSS